MSIREKLSVVAAGTIKPYYPFTPVESLYFNKASVQGPLENYNYDNTGEYSLNTFTPGSTATARIFNTDKLIENVWLELRFEKHVGVTDNTGIMFYGYDAIDSITYRIGGEERQTFYGYNMPFKWIQELSGDIEKYKKFYAMSGPLTQACLKPAWAKADNTVTVPAVFTAAQNESINYIQGEVSSTDYANGTSKWDYVYLLLPLPQATVQNRYINGVKALPNYMTDKGLQIDVKFSATPARTIAAASIKYKFLDTYKDDELKQVVYKYPYKHYYDDSYTLSKQGADHEYSLTINSFKYGEVTQLMLRVENGDYLPGSGTKSKYFGVPLKDIQVEVNNQVVFRSSAHSYPVTMLDSTDGFFGEVRPVYVDTSASVTDEGTADADGTTRVAETLGKRGYYYVIPLAPILDNNTHQDYTMGMSLLSKSLVVKFKVACDLTTGLTYTGSTITAGKRVWTPVKTGDGNLRVYTQTSYNAILQFDGRNVKFQT